MTREDTVGRWSVEKLGLLGKYLSAYTKILSKLSWCRGYEYIDAFAGSGKPKTREEQKYIDGSPRVALKIEPPFTRYHFIELTSWRGEQLKSLGSEFPKTDIKTYLGDCNRELPKILSNLLPESKKRAVAFVDPFGMQMDWNTMEGLARSKTIEVFVNFPIMALNRILPRRPGKITSKNRERMNLFWGSQDWLNIAYEDELTLFGREKIKKRSSEFLVNAYKGKLKGLFPHCVEPNVLMRNSKNAPLYYLIFAGHNPTGVKIAEFIFKKYITGR